MIRASRFLLVLLLSLTTLTAISFAQWPSYINRYPISNATKTTVADLNGDGFLDLATLAYATHEVVIEYALAGGGFGDEHRYQTPPGPADIQAADVNNDGAIDLVVANRDSHSISVFLNDQALGFDRHDFNVDVNDDHIALGDFNGDGKVDIAVANGGYPNTTHPRVSIYLGNGDGTFRDVFSVQTDSSVYRLFAQDVNRDGKVDLITMTYATIAVWKGSGDGRFSNIQNITTAGDLVGADLGDLNNDNAPDLVTTTDGFCGHGCGYIEHLDTWLNSGSGTFTKKASYGPAGTETDSAVAIGNLTGDTNNDVVYSDYYYNPSLGMFFGNGDGTLASPSIIQTFSNGAQDALIYDMDNDGRNDIVATESGTSVDVLFNQSYSSTCPSPNSKYLQSRICSPLPGSSTPSNLHLLATGNGPTKVLRMEAWLDGTKVYQRLSNRLDSFLNISGGSHKLSINTYDYFGHVNKQTASFTAASSNSGCTATGSDRTITVCSPTSSTVTSPVTFSAAAQDSRTVSSMQIYIDGTLRNQIASKSLSTSLSLSAGTHKVTIKAWDSVGSFSNSFSISVQSSAGCTASGTDRTVTICAPASNATVSSPVTISAAAQDSRSVSSMQVYVDGTVKYSVSAKSFSTSLAMAAGTRKITVKAWDSLGSYSKTIYVTVN